MFPETVSRGRNLIGRLKKGDDLLVSLTRVCIEGNLRLGKLQAIGAISKAKVGFYLQDKKEYVELDFDQNMEIIALQGNVSLKGGLPFIHAHVALMGSDGRVIGGHLMEGTEIFACEYILNEYIPDNEENFSRALDDETNLFLWPGV